MNNVDMDMQGEDVPDAANYTGACEVVQGTIKPFPSFEGDHIETVGKDFRKAFKGIGTDEGRIIRLLTDHTNEQRQEYMKAYATAYGRNLKEDLEDELSGNFEELCLALLTPARLYDAKCLRRAMEGAGTNDKWLIELLCPRTNQEMQEINEAYTELYKTKLSDDVVDETSGVYQKILVSVVQGNRAETTEEEVDMNKVKEDAKELYDAGEGQLGTDEEVFNRIFALRSWPHMRAMCKEYQTISGRDLEDSVQREFSFNAEKALLAIVKYAKDPHMYFAERIQCALRDDSDDSLTRLLVSHSETDLENIKTKFQFKCKKSLASDIRDETRGDFRKLLLRIVDPKQNFK